MGANPNLIYLLYRLAFIGLDLLIMFGDANLEFDVCISCLGDLDFDRIL